MRNLYNTITHEGHDLSKDDLRHIALELIRSMKRNNSKWDYVDQINEAIKNINENTNLNFKNKEI